MWQKKNKGPKYKGQYMKINSERVIVLIGLKAGKIHTITAESWQMLKNAGWKKV